MAGNGKFRIGVSDGITPETFPHVDLSPIKNDPNIEIDLIKEGTELKPEDVENLDGLVLLLNKITPATFHPNGRLSVIARMGVGYDTIDVPACTKNGVALCITPDAVRRPVAVAVMTFLLALTTKLFKMDEITRGGPAIWPQRTQHWGVGLVGRTFGLVGIGNIGADVARLLKPFDMRLIGYDPYIDPAKAKELGIELKGLEDVFREADVVSVHTPLTPETRGIVNAERLALMKPTAYLINTSRGPVVDQKALTKVLQNRAIAGAGLDVLEKEPPEADDPILKLDNVILAPHALCWTDQCFGTMGDLDVAAMYDVMHGREPRVIVNRDVLENQAWRAKLNAYRETFGG
ncbi:MAG: dehydrogenase [Rhodospirillaceae bacterium]|nr:dehydrogenase [Rhodospirillaceae bacterium]